MIRILVRAARGGGISKGDAGGVCFKRGEQGKELQSEQGAWLFVHPPVWQGVPSLTVKSDVRPADP